MTKSRMMEKRFSIHEGDGERIYIDDDDFHWDALLRVSGDFESCEEKKRYAQAICDVLNAAEDSIPYRPAAETSAAQPFTPQPVKTWEPDDNGLCKHCGLTWMLHIAQDERGRTNVCAPISSPANR